MALPQARGNSPADHLQDSRVPSAPLQMFHCPASTSNSTETSCSQCYTSYWFCSSRKPSLTQMPALRSGMLLQQHVHRPKGLWKWKFQKLQALEGSCEKKHLDCPGGPVGRNVDMITESGASGCEERVTGNWKKGNPCQKAAKQQQIPAELCSQALGKAKFVCG